MQTRRSVVVNGDLGSGKTTVTTLLAARLGIKRISVGDIYRTMAAQRGVTALQLSLHAELDDKIDHYLDQLQSDLATSGEQLVVDSRLAWHFFTSALKVHLIAEPTVAAHRVLARPADDVERYTSLEEARSWLASRSESERTRFLTRYGVDKTRLSNYDVICDATRATPDEIVERIIAELTDPSADERGPTCYLDPQRVYPTADVAVFTEDTSAGLENGALAGGDEDSGDPILVGYAAPYFYVIDGHRLWSSAIRAGRTLIRATLVAEAEADSDGRRHQDTFFTTRVTPARTKDWADALRIQLPPVRSDV
jgi:CMP/dCMP kinase